ncbi:hypothetical protein [Methanospirillum sp.]|uniref:hypothetical protein n=1 Tax=Methanospirillum sp. TaxID=45200 RepID=UPI002D7E203A|nr:hypothetical protein [Methanospirillum sp.]
MERGEKYTRTGVLLLAVSIAVICIMICGCVEVTPPSGEKNASAYGSVGSSGNLTSGLESKTSTPAPANSSSAPGNVSGSGSSQASGDSSPGINSSQIIPPDVPVVKVTPRSLQGLPNPSETQSYSALNNRTAIGPNAEFVTIYDINHTFSNDAVAYTYTVKNPPLYVDLKIAPEIETHVISYDKRTGDKEGLINVTVNRPPKDAWFEMRVYDLKDGSEVLTEGYGKTYSQSNKTVVLRSSGSYQFDLLGNNVNASVILKVPVSSDALEQYQNVTSLIDTKKQEAGLIPAIYLIPSDLPADWKVSGDITYTASQYQSIFVNPASGYKLEQNIKKYDSTDKALTALADLKKAAASENPAATLIGQGGYQFETVRKTEVAFVQGQYLIELTSFSVPAVSLTDLQRYGVIIVSRVNSSG